MPYDVISQQFVDNLMRLTEQCALSLEAGEGAGAFRIAGTIFPERDLATGEIVEGESEAKE